MLVGKIYWFRSWKIEQLLGSSVTPADGAAVAGRCCGGGGVLFDSFISPRAREDDARISGSSSLTSTNRRIPTS